MLFKWPVILLATALPFVDEVKSHSMLKLGNSFGIEFNKREQSIKVFSAAKIIWETAEDFLSASSGQDQVLGTEGNFKILQADLLKCGGQQFDKISYDAKANSINERAVTVHGRLSECGGTPFTMSFWVPKKLPDRVAFAIAAQPEAKIGSTISKLFLKFRSEKTEDFYGLGAQASFASLKGQSIPIFSREQGVGRGDKPTTSIEDIVSYFSGGNQYTTYTAIPQYVTSHARAFYLTQECTGYAVFDFQDYATITIRYDSLSMKGHILKADSMLEVISMVTDYTGKMPELPYWVDDGAVLGIQGGQGKVEKTLEESKQYDCPIVAVWLQDWSGQHLQSVPLLEVNITRVWWNWESDSDLYPTWGSFVQSLREDYGVRTLSYINPFLANVSSKADGFRRNLFVEAVDASYMIETTKTNSTAIVSSGPGIEAGIVDLKNPSARLWFEEILLEQVWAFNISGYMCDFGEYTPTTPDTKFAVNGINPFFYHNEYPRDWTILQRDALRRKSKRDRSIPAEAVVFHRSASLGSNAHMNLYWAGDQDTSWGLNDGIKSAVTIMGHMGMCGYTQGHSDIGGYTTTFELPSFSNPSGVVNRSAELLGRWAELAAVSSAMFRSHEGSIPAAHAQFYTNSSTYTYFSYCARMFQSLSAYRRQVFATESAKGWPLLRMPVLYHPNDPVAKQISYQSFYLGPSLYAAPVLDPGRLELDVYLPGKKESDTYTHVWSNIVYAAGQTIRVSTPYGQPAVFLVNDQKGYLEDFLDFVRKEKNTLVGFNY